ncbi:excitatory amino acid transporter 3 [Brachionus plicatilis]|uniref:Amino acid transporter n=1 Tax=Brachionus plicatilis TaxID=10195 RepID=A0A3M7RXD0_BRAPC|nr:excitatory amino acid transporter 3 [Brachionus plicatilis]
MNNNEYIEPNEVIYSEIPKRSTIKNHVGKKFKENILLFSTILSVIIGSVLGFYLRKYTKIEPNKKQYFGFLGEIFLRMLKFFILPLISSSLICGIASLGIAKRTANVALKAFVYYLTTTFLAVILGLILVVIIHPGAVSQNKIGDQTTDILNGQKISPLDTALDLIRNLFPDNIIQVGFVQFESKIVPKYKLNGTNDTHEIDYWYPVPGERPAMNVLGLVMFCLVFGCTISRMDNHGKFLYDFCEAINEALIQIIGYVMMFSPIGICSLICGSIISMEDISEIFEKISMYTLTVLLGLFIHGFMVLPSIYLILTRRNVFIYAKNMIEALLVALATSSSNATLPVTFKCIEEKNKIPKSISRFVLPVGATINMDGTALYEAVGAIFIAQMHNIHLSLADYVVTSFTATLASIGAAGIPSAGLVTMVVVLSALNLPQSHISLIYAVDWFLDRFRTMVNVWGDSIGTGIVAHLCEKEQLNAEKFKFQEFNSCNERSCTEPDFVLNKAFAIEDNTYETAL